MSNQQTLKYWCAKVLIPYGFPTPPLTKLNAGKTYCKNYPYLYAYKNTLYSTECEISLIDRNIQAEEVFSFYNLPFIVVQFLLHYLSCL